MNSLKKIRINLLQIENIYYLFIIIFIFFLDRFSKIQILKSINENKIFINDYINFDLIWNTGIGFGLLSSSSTIIYNLITLLIGTIITILIFISLMSNKIEKLIYCIIIGGAVGNLYDRINYHAVPDFIDLHYNNFHWFTFNVADMFITIGVSAFLIKGYFIKKLNS
tara:strand:- start:9226 stop:9726 length:501 start_codon:yes stop_codon:yes gene_type:complete